MMLLFFSLFSISPMHVRWRLPYIIEDDSTQPALDVQRTSSKVPLKVLTSETCRKPSRDFQGTKIKIDDLKKNLFFRSNSLCSIHLFLFFTGRTNFQNFLTGRSKGHLQDPNAGRSGDQMMVRFRNVSGMSSRHIF